MRLLVEIGIAAAIWCALFFLVRFLPMKPQTRNRLLRVLAIVLIIASSGPEIGIGMEALLALDALGAELFLTSLIVGLRMLPIWFAFTWLKKLVEKVDPYFLIPSPAQVRDCPAIAVHAIPCLVPVCLAVALWHGMPPDA